MQSSRSSRALQIVILGVLITLIGRFLGLSLGIIFLLLAAVLVVTWVYTYWLTWRTLDWFREYNSYSSRVSDGDADTVIAELTTRRAEGDDTPETAITLAATYNYIGRGQEAEPLAFEAFDAVTENGDCDAENLSPRIRCDVAYLTRYDALLAQGRFVEAAGGLRERIPNAIQPNFQTALVTWAYFLGEAYDQAKEMLGKVQEPGARLNNERMLSPRFELIVAYLRHVLDGAATQAIIAEHRDNIDEWAVTAERNATNPYGKRLAEIVDSMRLLAAEATSDTGSTSKTTASD